MIKSDKGKMHFEGTESQIRAEFCCIVKDYHDSILKEGLGMSEEDATQRVCEDVELALMTKEPKLAKELMKRLVK